MTSRVSQGGHFNFGRKITGYQQIKIEVNHIMKMIVDKGVFVG